MRLLLEVLGKNPFAKWEKYILKTALNKEFLLKFRQIGGINNNRRNFSQFKKYRHHQNKIFLAPR